MNHPWLEPTWGALGANALFSRAPQALLFPCLKHQMLFAGRCLDFMLLILCIGEGVVVGVRQTTYQRKPFVADSPQVLKFGNPRFLDVEGELIVLEGSSAIVCLPATA